MLQNILKSKLSELAEKISIPCDVLGRGCENPSMELYFSNGAVGTCHYLCVDDDKLEHFFILIETKLEDFGASDGLRQALCDRFNAASLGGTAYVKLEESGVWLRGFMPDAAVAAWGSAYSTFVEVYEIHLLKLDKMLKVLEVVHNESKI